MEPKEFKKLIKRAGLTQAQFAEKIGKTTRYIAAICIGERKVQKWMVLILEQMISLNSVKWIQDKYNASNIYK